MTPLLRQKERGTKKPLDEIERREWKVGLKLNIQKTKIMASGPITSWQIDGANSGKSDNYFLGLQNHCIWWPQPQNLKTLALWKKRYDQPRQHIKKQRHYFINKGQSSQSYGFSSSHVWIWELDHKAERQRIDAFKLWCVGWDQEAHPPVAGKKVHPSP